MRRDLYCSLCIAVLVLALCGVCSAAEITVKVGVMYTFVDNPAEDPFGGLTRSFDWDWRYFDEELRRAGGIPMLNGDVATLEFVAVNDGGFNVESTTAVVNDFCDGVYGEVNYLFSGLGSTLGLAAAQAVHQCYLRGATSTLQLFVPSATSEDLYSCPRDGWDAEQWYPCEGPSQRRFDFMWGVAPTTQNLAQSVVTAFLREEPSTAAVYYEDQPFTTSMRHWGEIFAEDNAIRVVSSVAGPSVSTAEELAGVLADFRVLQPDVVFLYVNPSGCSAVYDALLLVDWIPTGLAVTTCGATPQLDLRYAASFSLWDSRLRGSTYVEDDFPTFFSSENQHAPDVYATRLGERFPEFFQTTTTGTYMAACYILANSIAHAETASAADIREAIGQTVMNSFWGRIQYDARGRQVGHLGVSTQFDRNYTRQVIAPVSARSANLVYPAPQWDEREFSQSYLSEPSEVAMVTLAAACILISALLALVVVVKWNHAVWISAQRAFVLLFLLGSVLTYATVFLWTLYATDATCTAMVWVLIVGVCVMLATLLAKTWRVFRVFLNKSLQVMRISNLYLAAVISGLLVLPVGLLVVWTALGGVEAEYRVESADILTENYYSCQADTEDVVFASLLVGYIGVLAISGAVFAYFIRDVTYLLYNESRYIGYALYTMLVFGILGIALQASGAVSREGLFIIRSCLLMGGTLIMVLVLFLPKLYFMMMGYSKDQSTSASMLGGNADSGRRPSEVRSTTTSTVSDNTAGPGQELTEMVSRIFDDE